MVIERKNARVSQRPGMSSDGRNSTARRMRGAGKCEGDGNRDGMPHHMVCKMWM